MVSMEIGYVSKEIDALKEYYNSLIEKLQNELDEIIKLKQMIYPFTDEHTLTIKFVPMPDLDKTIELIFKRIGLEVRKQLGIKKREQKDA